MRTRVKFVDSSGVERAVNLDAIKEVGSDGEGHAWIYMGNDDYLNIDSTMDEALAAIDAAYADNVREDESVEDGAAERALARLKTEESTLKRAHGLSVEDEGYLGGLSIAIQVIEEEL